MAHILAKEVGSPGCEGVQATFLLCYFDGLPKFERCTAFIHEISDHFETWKGRKVVHYSRILLLKEWIILVSSFFECQKGISIGKENVSLLFTY